MKNQSSFYKEDHSPKIPKPQNPKTPNLSLENSEAMN
jgi:hypothetical protein